MAISYNKLWKLLVWYLTSLLHYLLSLIKGITT